MTLIRTIVLGAAISTSAQLYAEDCAPLGHLPGYTSAEHAERRNYDNEEFDIAQSDGDVKRVMVAGKVCRQLYSPEGDTPMSDLEIQSNYRAQLKRLGAQTLFEDGRNTVARLTNASGHDTWVKVYSQETTIEVAVSEEKPFEASFVQPSADALKNALDHQGHVALYLHFDSGKATLAPDAAPTVTQVSKLMKDNPNLQLAVEGHTDAVGSREANLALSKQRAATVVAALIQAGVAASRLSTAGYGPDHPVGDNASSEGRAQNRRVELVRRKG